MRSVTIGTTPTLIYRSGVRQFCHIFNNSSTPIFLCYDGSDASLLTIANGFPLLPNQSLTLDNTLQPDASGSTYTGAIYGISASGGNDVRIQG